jgi:phenylalanine-4-hydroxylase
MERRTYSHEDHRIWSLLYRRMRPQWERWGTSVFLRGLERLDLRADRIPQLHDVNKRLKSFTGFQAVEVEGYMEASAFFAHLRRREFPTVTKIRRVDQLDYLPEPDVFHDVAGHVPMHTDPVFAGVLQRFGEIAGRAESDLALRERLARFFWFTVEFGLLAEGGKLKAYGSGLMSSAGEIEYALTSANVRRRAFQLEEVMATPFEIDHFQNQLYVVESFEQLYEAVDALESSLPLVSGKKKTNSAPRKK